MSQSPPADPVSPDHRPPSGTATDSPAPVVRGWVSAGPADVQRMVSRLYLTHGDRARKLSAFWTLLVLSAVIAAAGIIADSPATVIGAMIVAPLMTPILGTSLAIVLADRRQLIHSLTMMLAGAATVVVVGYLLGLLIQLDVVAETNAQVASRVSPRLIDLVAALATGLVGAFALVRSDVSDALPGVAIAISLVPPLAVIGLTLESGAYGESWGALLLFGTNVAAIIATGTALLLVAGLREAAQASGLKVGSLSVRTVASVAVSILLVAVPLGYGSWRVLQEQMVISQAEPVATQWANDRGWDITGIAFQGGILQVLVVAGSLEDDAGQLRIALDEAGLVDTDVEVVLVVGGSRNLPGQ